VNGLCPCMPIFKMRLLLLILLLALTYPACHNVSCERCPKYTDTERREISFHLREIKKDCDKRIGGYPSEYLLFYYSSGESFEHIVMITQRDGNKVEIHFSRKERSYYRGPWEYDYSETTQLTSSEIDSILFKSEGLGCIRFDLDSNAESPHSNKYFLSFPRQYDTAYVIWEDYGIESLVEPLTSSERQINPDKIKVQQLISSVLKKAGFEAGSKVIYSSTSLGVSDSVKCYITLTSIHLTRETAVYFDGQPIERNEYGEHIVILHVADTSNLMNRARIVEYQYDGAVVEH
jgi:hypothetical protein